MLIEEIFIKKYRPGQHEVSFTRDGLISAAEALGVSPPKNLGDIIYSLRYRVPLPDIIQQKASPGREWAIFPGGNAVYTFRTVPFNLIEPRSGLGTTRLPDSTPGVISRYSLSDEQALLGRIRYNRLLDVFMGLPCYHLQSHLRTSITVINDIKGTADTSQVETDDLYIGIDQHGAHHILPVQAKGGSDTLTVVQIWQDFKVAEQKFPDLIARPIAVQFIDDDVIAMFEFEEVNNEITIKREHHYKLVPQEKLTSKELVIYRTASQCLHL